MGILEPCNSCYSFPHSSCLSLLSNFKRKEKDQKDQNTKQNMEWAKRSNERKCWLLNLSRLCHKFSYKTSWFNISNGPDIIVTAWITLSITPLKKKNVTSCSAAKTFRDQGEVVKTSTAAVTQPHKYSIVGPP